jgi:hypothetical protein
MRFTFKAGVFCLLIVVTAITACRKDELPYISCSEKSNSIDIAGKYMAGTYNWVYTRITYPGGGGVETPASTGLNIKYVFKSNGKVDYYENSVLKSVDNYAIAYEFTVSAFPSDSATIVVINDKQTGQRKEFFRTYLCSDSAMFFNPYSSIDFRRYYRRN